MKRNQRSTMCALILVLMYQVLAADTARTAEKDVPDAFVAHDVCDDGSLCTVRWSDSSPQGSIYEIRVWPLDGVATTLPKLAPECHIEESNLKVFCGRSVVYVIPKCYFDEERDIWLSRSGGAFNRIGTIQSPWPLTFHEITDSGSLVLARVISWYSWEVKEFDRSGLIRDESYQFEPDSAFDHLHPRPMPQAVTHLPNGMWLCVEVSPVRSIGNLMRHTKSHEEFMRVLSESREWLLYWVFDPDTRRMAGQGVERLTDVSWGSVPGWLEFSCELVLQDTTGVAFFAQSGPRLPRYYTEGAGKDNVLHLVRFSPAGRLLRPGGDTERQLLHQVSRKIERPYKRMVHKIPFGLRSPEMPKGAYRIIEIDSSWGISITEYSTVEEE